MIIGSGFLIAAKKMSPAGYFDGSQNYLSISTNATTAFNFGTDDFTIEMWINKFSYSQKWACMIGSALSSWQNGNVWFQATGDDPPNSIDRRKLIFGTYNTERLVRSTSTINLNTWYHVAVTRQGTTFRMFINGILESSGTSSETIDFGAGNSVMFGRNGWDGSFGYWHGCIDDLRVTKGVARYTSNFTVPKDELSLTNDAYAANVSVLLNMRGGDQSTVFVDSSNNLFTISVNGNTKILNILSR